MIKFVLLRENLDEILSVLWPIVSNKCMRVTVTAKMLFSGLNGGLGLSS